MITLYGYTILADLALLAILVAIFAFAVSIYKGASELCIKEQENASNRRKEIIEKIKTELTVKLQLITNGTSINGVRAELNSLDNEIRNIDKPVLRIIEKAKCLTARNLVFAPGSLLLVSIITSGIAIAVTGALQTIMWVLSLLLLASSLYFIYRCIRAIEFFSNFIDLGTLMEQALEKHAQKMKPVVNMMLWDFTTIVEHGKIEEVKYHVFLEHGPIGRNTHIRFLATDELHFPEEETEPFNYNKEKMTNPKLFNHKIGDLNPRANKVKKFKVKAPDNPGEYVMSYWILCDEYAGEEITFKIRVV